MPFTLSSIFGAWKTVAGALTFRRDNSPIESAVDVESFVATRAAFVAQKTLYGYLKTRIGTRYPRVFDDAPYVQSINIAKYHIFAACLSDLAIFAVATALNDQQLSDPSRRALATRCYRRGLDDNADDVPIEFKADESMQNFTARLQVTDWTLRALHWDNFTESPRALLKWAPIADHLKEEDAEIVQNSIKFAWRDIREQFRQRLVQEAVLADLRQQLNTALRAQTDS